MTSKLAWSPSVLGAEVNRQRGRVLVDEAAEVAGHLLTPEMGLEVGFHMILPGHLLAAEQADKLGLAVHAKHGLCAGVKGGDPWNRRGTSWRQELWRDIRTFS